MKNYFLLLLCCLLFSCEKGDSPSPNNSSGGGGSNAIVKNPELPDDFQLSGCFLEAFNFDLNSVAGNEKQGYKFTYDQLNRLTKVEAVNNTSLKTESAYTYTKGKVMVTFDKPLVSVYSAKGSAELTLDAKNRVIGSITKLKGYANDQLLSEETLKISYKYDDNGYLIEDTNELGDNIDITKYQWTNGNLTKTITTRTQKGKPDKREVTQTYTYDTTKKNGTWNGGTGSNSAAYYFYQDGFLGKPNANIITQIINTTREFETENIVFDYTLKTVTDYTYTYDSKGYPETLNGNTKVTTSGSLPLGITIPETFATFKANLKYNCK
jgi:hypothetical protein